jgi:hypothetical protein
MWPGDFSCQNVSKFLCSQFYSNYTKENRNRTKREYTSRRKFHILSNCTVKWLQPRPFIILKATHLKEYKFWTGIKEKWNTVVSTWFMAIHGDGRQRHSMQLHKTLPLLSSKGKGKGKFVPMLLFQLRTMLWRRTVEWRYSSKLHLYFDLGTSWRWVVSFTSQPPYSQVPIG